MQLNDKQRLVLKGILRDRQRLAGMDWHAGDNLPRKECGRHRLRIQQARDGYVPMNLGGWIGHPPTASEAVMYHREYHRLEAMGLIERYNFYGGRRTSHLSLTEAGEEIVCAILAGQEPPERRSDDEAPIDWENIELLPIELPVEADENSCQN